MIHVAEVEPPKVGLTTSLALVLYLYHRGVRIAKEKKTFSHTRPTKRETTSQLSPKADGWRLCTSLFLSVALASCAGSGCFHSQRGLTGHGWNVRRSISSTLGMVLSGRSSSPPSVLGVALFPAPRCAHVRESLFVSFAHYFGVFCSYSVGGFFALGQSERRLRALEKKNFYQKTINPCIGKQSDDASSKTQAKAGLYRPRLSTLKFSLSSPLNFFSMMFPFEMLVFFFHARSSQQALVSHTSRTSNKVPTSIALHSACTTGVNVRPGNQRATARFFTCSCHSN